MPTNPLTKDVIDVSIMHPKDDPEHPGISVGDWFAHGMSLVDGCPECPNVQPPMATIPTIPDRGWCNRYVCADCGHTWTTEWKDD